MFSVYSQYHSFSVHKNRTEAVFECQFVKNNENSVKRYDRLNIIRLFKFSFEQLVRTNDLSTTATKNENSEILPR